MQPKTIKSKKLIVLNMEVNLNVFEKGTLPEFFTKKEDDLKFFFNGRQPVFLGKWKTTSLFSDSGR